MLREGSYFDVLTVGCQKSYAHRNELWKLRNVQKGWDETPKNPTALARGPSRGPLRRLCLLRGCTYSTYVSCLDGKIIPSVSVRWRPYSRHPSKYALNTV